MLVLIFEAIYFFFLFGYRLNSRLDFHFHNDDQKLTLSDRYWGCMIRLNSVILA